MKKLVFNGFKRVAGIVVRSSAYKFLPEPIKQAGFKVFAKLKPSVANVLGHTIYLNPSDRIISHHLLFFGIFEPYETSLFLEALTSDMTVVDIGANIGYYTILAAEKIGPAGHIIAFEPEPQNFSLLKKNVTVNDVKNASLFQKAVSDRESKIKLYLAAENMGDHRIYDPSGTREFVEIEAIVLDDFLESHGLKPDIIKMDIQGAELKAFEGMRRTLAEAKTLTLFTEYWPSQIEEFGGDPRKFLEGLVELGFHLSVIDEHQRSVQDKNVDEIIRMCGSSDAVNLMCRKP